MYYTVDKHYLIFFNNALQCTQVRIAVDDLAI